MGLEQAYTREEVHQLCSLSTERHLYSVTLDSKQVDLGADFENQISLLSREIFLIAYSFEHRWLKLWLRHLLAVTLVKLPKVSVP